MIAGLNARTNFIDELFRFQIVAVPKKPAPRVERKKADEPALRPRQREGADHGFLEPGVLLGNLRGMGRSCATLFGEAVAPCAWRQQEVQNRQRRRPEETCL